MLTITPTEEKPITRLVCPKCREKVPRIGLTKDSKIEGLTFKCKRCGTFWKVKSSKGGSSDV